MKKIILYILIAFWGVLIFSCNDLILDTQPLDKFSELDVWNDVNLAQGFVYSTYSSVMINMVRNPQDGWPYVGAGNDDFTDNITISGNNIVAKDQMDKYFDAGWYAFSIIRQCNLIIEKVNESDEINENDKKHLIAQGKMLRALIYFSRARLFGKYIIVDKVLTTDDELELPRTSTIKETYDFILNDLGDDVIDGLPTTAEAGALTKGAALALKAEVALHGAAYIETGKSDYYKIAKDASEELFALGVYELDNNYKDLFNNYDHALGSNEIILALYKNNENTSFADTPMQFIVPNCDENKNHEWVTPKLVESFEGWAGRWPSNDLVNDYLVVDSDGAAKKWDETSYYDDFMDNGGYVSKAIYANRDKRFYASIVYDSTMYFNNLVTIRKGGNMHWESNRDGNWSMTHSGYYFRKGVYESTKLWYSDKTPYHQIILRLGRSYLNYAEVMLRMGEYETAIDYINKTRTVHGGLPPLEYGMSPAEVWEYYNIERRVDLFYENDRYWTLLREGKEAGDIVIPELNSGQTAFEIGEDGRSFEVIPLPISKSENERVFSVRRYLFPVPENERLLNDKLDQNPGW